MTLPTILIALLPALSGTGPSAPADPPQAASSLESLRPISMAELKELQTTLLFGEQDVRYLRMSRPVLEPRLEELLDVWYGFVGSTPHLLASFVDRESGEPDADYLGGVRKRFGQWVLDTADARFDEAWLARQLELGLRHHRAKKNVAFRHLVALSYPLVATMEPFLVGEGRSAEDVQGMTEAWRKAVLLTAILWSQPYVRAEDF